MKAISKGICAAILIVLGTAFQAQALPITITPGSEVESGDQNNNNVILAYLFSNYVGLSGPLYKADADTGAEEGALAASYQTSFFPSGSPSAANISYVGGSIVTGDPIYLLVKDGRQEPAWYLFNLTTIAGGPWNGTETLNLSGFWPGPGAISNVQIFATQVPTPVPDGGSTAMLLGSVLFAVGVVRRKFNGR